MRSHTRTQVQNKRFLRNILFPVVLAVCLLLSTPAPAAAENSIGSADAPEREAVEKDWNERYAVSIYGIQHDLYEGGGERKAGLTFGPAAGKFYLDSYHAHVTEQAYLENPEKNLCLHWMSWEEIAEQAAEDPSVFHPCLVNGCTHAVDLKLNDTLLYRDFTDRISGDGASAMFDGFKRELLRYCKGYAFKGGWPSSRVRAILNGADELADVNAVGEELMLKEEESVFSCFPEELRNRIVAKEVVSDLGNGTGESRCVTTYDKLWLFSAYELYGVPSKAEGTPYERNVLLRSKAARIGDGYSMFSEKGNETWAWFRSISALAEVLNHNIYGGGHGFGVGSFNNYYGLAPGFCLP